MADSDNVVVFDMDWGDIPPEETVSPESAPPVPQAQVPVVSAPPVVAAPPAPPMPAIPDPVPVPVHAPAPSPVQESPQSQPVPVVPAPVETAPPAPAPPPVVAAAPPAVSSVHRLIPGQRIELAKLGLPKGEFLATLTHDVEAPHLGWVCAGLGASDTVFSAAYCIHSGGSFPCRSVTASPAKTGEKQLQICLGSAASGLHRVVIACFAADQAAASRVASKLTLQMGDTVIAETAFEARQFEPSSGILLAELYMRHGFWRIYVSGEPIAGGLNGFSREYGL
jgi:stress response protein SCP2